MTADFESREVHLRVIGKNPSKVADEELRKGDTSILGTGGRFELISGYSYCIFFGKRIPPHLQFGGCNTFIGVECFEGEGTAKKIKLDECPTEYSSRCGEKSKPTLESPFRGEHSAVKPAFHQCDTLFLLSYGIQCPSDMIAAFDLDGTLIDTASGRKFARDPKDWKLMPHVNDKLKELHMSGYRIVIFTNQGGLPKGKPTKDDFMKKMNAVAERIDVPLLVMVASGQDIYRKPCTGMWNHLVKNENSGIIPNLSRSFYVGDAAGRCAEWKQGVYILFVY